MGQSTGNSPRPSLMRLFTTLPSPVMSRTCRGARTLNMWMSRRDVSDGCMAGHVIGCARRGFPGMQSGASCRRPWQSLRAMDLCTFSCEKCVGLTRVTCSEHTLPTWTADSKPSSNLMRSLRCQATTTP